MTLITWQAIGAVIGIVLCLVALLVPIILRRSVDDEFDFGFMIAYCLVWIVMLLTVVIGNWSTIGVGLFGVIR